MRVLIVEDEPVSARLAGSLFAPYGETAVATDGEAALSCYESARASGKPFDLLVLDIMMPHASGQEVLAAIRMIEQQEGIPLGQGTKVIMCSAHNDTQNLYDAHAEGCSDYLHKPIDGAAVDRVMEKLGIKKKS